jgi:hypothetical protein
MASKKQKTDAGAKDPLEALVEVHQELEVGV